MANWIARLFAKDVVRDEEYYRHASHELEARLDIYDRKLRNQRKSILESMAERDVLATQLANCHNYSDEYRKACAALKEAKAELTKECKKRGLKIAEMVEVNKIRRRDITVICDQRDGLEKKLDDRTDINMKCLHVIDELEAENGRLEKLNEKLIAVIEHPERFQKMLEDAGGDTDWNHWAIKLLVYSVEQSMGNGKHNAAAIEVGIPGTPSHFDVTVCRAGYPTVADKLAERNDVITGLLSAVGRLVAHDEDDHTFKLVFTLEEQAFIKQAKKLLEDSKPCGSGTIGATETAGAGSSGSPESEASASTS